MGLITLPTFEEAVRAVPYGNLVDTASDYFGIPDVGYVEDGRIGGLDKDNIACVLRLALYFGTEEDYRAIYDSKPQEAHYAA